MLKLERINMEVLQKMLTNEVPLQTCSADLKSSMIERIEMLSKLTIKAKSDIEDLKKAEKEKAGLASSLEFVTEIIAFINSLIFTNSF